LSISRDSCEVFVPTLRSFAVRPPLDHPKVTHGDSFVAEKVRAEGLRHQLWRETPLIFFQITPSLYRLDHMSVRVDRSHRPPPLAVTCQPPHSSGRF
jgi:hypothetical protein